MRRIANHRAYVAMILATDGLQSYWKLNEASGNFADSKGAVTGTPGTMTYGATALLGAPNTDTAATFSGTGSRVDMGDVYDFAGLLPFSVEFWLRPSVTASQTLVAKLSSATGDGWRILTSSGSVPQFQRRSVGGTNNTTSGSVSIMPALVAGSIYHVVCTYDGTTMLCAVNGGVGLSVPGVTTLASSLSLVDHALPLRLGVNSNSTTVGIYSGDMGHVGVYNRALGGAEIARHYRAGRKLL